MDENLDLGISFDLPKNQSNVIKAIGVGGGGSNAINHMYKQGIKGVDFVICNTDAQALNNSGVPNKIQLGVNLTEGLGAGANPEVGEKAALESSEDIMSMLNVNTKMVFITAGMGGGTGTGSAHVIARAAKELNILTVGVITLPFLYEGPSRMRRAQQGLEELRKHVDTIIVIPNQNLFKVASEQTTFEESFELSNHVLLHGVQSITDLMVRPGLINLDFADVEHVMSSMGKAMMGTGEAEGEGRASKAAEMAITNQLIDDYTLKGAKGLLVNITGGKDLKLFEVDEAVNKVRAEVDPEAELIIGAITDPTLEGIMRVSIVATALDGQQPESKSVINMVHRIQNRNPGYYETSSIQKNNNFNNNHSNFIPSTNGANALQINNEDIKETENEMLNSMLDENMVMNSLSAEESKNSTSIDTMIAEESPIDLKENIDTNQNNFKKENLNGLENFELSEENPQLFNVDDEIENETKEEDSNIDSQEDELEIPAFLRRQKN